jgi:general secretion pathway protein G
MRAEQAPPGIGIAAPGGKSSFLQSMQRPGVGQMQSFSKTKSIDGNALGLRRKGHGEDGYTLVEILVVLAIIAMIMGLVGPRVISYLSDSKTKAAKIQISNLVAALDLYYLDTGIYPDGAEGLQALVRKPESATSWNGPYLQTGALPNDPWGKPYLYTAQAQSGHYAISSLGADGREGGSGNDADITQQR